MFVRTAWISFGALPYREGGGGDLTARVLMLLKSRASLTYFQACFLPGRAKDLSAPRNICFQSFLYLHISSMKYIKRKERNMLPLLMLLPPLLLLLVVVVVVIIGIITIFFMCAH
jgi:hypothetical protein